MERSGRNEKRLLSLLTGGGGRGSGAVAVARTGAAAGAASSGTPSADGAQARLAAASRRNAEARRAAEELVEATWRQTFAALFRLTGGDRELAADLTQEAYRKAWAALDGFDGRARFATWLYRIAYTTFLNHARRPHRVVPLEERPASGGDLADDGDGPSRDRDGGHADPRPLPDEALAASRSHDRLRRAVLELPEDLRYTVTARYWGDLPVREIARQEEITGAAVRKRLKKASILLAARLEDRP